MRIETNDLWGQFIGSSGDPVKDGGRRNTDDRDYRGDSSIYNTADRSLFPLLPKKKQVRVFHTLVSTENPCCVCYGSSCYQLKFLSKCIDCIVFKTLMKKGYSSFFTFF